MLELSNLCHCVQHPWKLTSGDFWSSRNERKPLSKQKCVLRKCYGVSSLSLHLISSIYEGVYPTAYLGTLSHISSLSLYLPSWCGGYIWALHLFWMGSHWQHGSVKNCPPGTCSFIWGVYQKDVIWKVEFILGLTLASQRSFLWKTNDASHTFCSAS